MRFNKAYWLWWFHHKLHVYRCGPVPTIGHNKVGGRWFRCPKITQELRALCDPEHKRYSRARRRALPEAWDDIYFSDVHPKCWKDCTKKRKQWL